MIALLAQLAFGCFAVYGIWTATFRVGIWALEEYGRRMNARYDRERMTTTAKAREVANEWMLKRLTPEDHAEIKRAIEDSKRWPTKETA